MATATTSVDNSLQAESASDLVEGSSPMKDFTKKVYEPMQQCIASGSFRNASSQGGQSLNFHNEKVCEVRLQLSLARKESLQQSIQQLNMSLPESG